MSSISNLTAGLDVLKDWLNEIVHNETHAPQFAEYGDKTGVVVMLEGSQDEPKYQPYIVLSATEQDAPEWGRDAKRAIVKAEVKANNFAGAIGEDGTVSKLSQILEDEVRAGYRTLRDAGLLGSSSRVTRNATDSKDKASETIIEHEIRFVFLSPEEN